MSNHRPPTDPGPSVASIVTGVALTLAAIGAAGYILWGPTLDPRAITGAALGWLLAVLLAAQTVARASQRAAAGHRIRAYRARQRAEAERLDRIAKRAEPEPYDPGPTRLNPSGWPVPIVQENPGPEYPTTVDTAVIEPPDYLIRAAEATLADRRTDETQRIDYGPSPAALRLIGVPVFRTEAERAAWMNQHTEPPRS